MSSDEQGRTTMTRVCSLDVHRHDSFCCMRTFNRLPLHKSAKLRMHDHDSSKPGIFIKRMPPINDAARVQVPVTAYANITWRSCDQIGFDIGAVWKDVHAHLGDKYSHHLMHTSTCLNASTTGWNDTWNFVKPVYEIINPDHSISAGRKHGLPVRFKVKSEQPMSVELGSTTHKDHFV